MMLLVTLRIHYLNNTVQVFLDLIYVHCLIEKLKICILLAKKAQQRVWGLSYMTHCHLLPRVTDLLP